MRIAVSGSSGLIGRALLPVLSSSGHEVLPLVRRPARDGEISWSPDAGTIADGALVGVDAVIHLAGAGIGDRRWSDDYKREILESRTKGTALLARTIAETDGGPTVLLSGSAIGIYGSSEDREFDERSPAGSGFLADVCVQWEAATGPAEDAGARVTHLRTGIVLSTDGGALKKQLPLFRLGLGGRFGSGRQWQSWISIEDEVRAIVHLLDSPLSGPVNLTAPHPVQNAEFATTLGAALHRPARLPVPEFGPKLLLGAELAENLLFTGQKVLPRRLLEDGFEFRHPDLATALDAELAG